MKARCLAALFVAVVFALTTALAFAAGDSWVVIKDKKGVCKVIEAKEKTPATIAGPFKTKDEAEKAEDKECPKGAASALEKIKEKAKKALDKAKSEIEKAKEKVKETVPSEKK